MTSPTPDPSGNIAPGLYHAEGDPPGTVRQWDGTQWVGAPVPAPPGAGAPAPYSSDKYGTVGIRIGAMLIDGIIFVALLFVAAIPFVEDTDPDANSFEFEVTGISAYVGPLIMMALVVVMVATLGGTPGKLILRLRVTTADGTTPPGFGPATMRALTWLPTFIPVVGIVIWFALGITSLVFINNDHERRSVFDRVAGTRVIRK
ncbi:MAG: RDD family protein [Acidimicrobiales bacterium]